MPYTQVLVSGSALRRSKGRYSSLDSLLRVVKSRVSSNNSCKNKHMELSRREKVFSLVYLHVSFIRGVISHLRRQGREESEDVRF